MHQQHEHSLLKAVPTRIFSFEEKIFGMTLQQLLTDIGAAASLYALTGGMPSVSRMIVCAALGLVTLVLVHLSVGEQSALQWLLLCAQFRMMARHTTWQSQQEEHTRAKGQPPSVQTTWIPLDHLHGGVMGYSEAGSPRAARGRSWVALEIEGKSVRYLPEAEQLQVYERFERFLVGCQFRLQFLSTVEPVNVVSSPALREARAALRQVEQRAPRLATLGQASIAYQERSLPQSSRSRHFVVIAVSAREEALHARVDGERGGIVRMLVRLILPPKAEEALSRNDLVDLLRTRITLVTDLFQQLDMRVRLLDDAEQLRLFASQVALGAEIPSFVPEEQADEATAAALHLVTPPAAPHAATSISGSGSLPRAGRPSHHAPHRKMRVRGLHREVCYERTKEQAHFEAETLRLADLVAPSSLTVHPDLLEVEVNGQKRYQRYVSVTGYGHQLLCGWLTDLFDLGLPMVVSSTFEPIDTRFMIGRLELQLVKLESGRLADQKLLKFTHATHTVEAEQVRQVLDGLARNQSAIFAVSLTIGIHAGSRARLEQRTRYLLSQLRQRRLRVQMLPRRQDAGWQASLPVCPPSLLQPTVNVPSSVVSTFLHATSGTIGTPTGVFLGFCGTGPGRKAVSFHPWSRAHRAANPHVVVIGESGKGKSWLGKTLTVGLMSQGIADVVVLDRDNDYLALHQALGEESQWDDLSGGCPINPLDLLILPDEVDPSDHRDRVAAFIDNTLLPLCSLILCEADKQLSKPEEAYLMHVLRRVYAERGLTADAIRRDPAMVRGPMPTFADVIAMIGGTAASDDMMRHSLLERLEKASYLFGGQTRISLEKPLTVFSIHDLDEKWYPLMTFVVRNFLLLHRSLHRDERYLAFVVEEASYMLRHPAARACLESGARGYRKLGIAQFTFSQDPGEFLQEGAVIIANAGTAFFLGMQPSAAAKLKLSPELEAVLTSASPGQAVMRCGHAAAAIQIASIPAYRTLFTTDPEDGKAIRAQERRSQQQVGAAPTKGEHPA